MAFGKSPVQTYTAKRARTHAQENAKELCETLKSDVSALRQLSEDTFSDIDPAFSETLSRAVEEQEVMRAEHEAARRELSAAVASAQTAVAAADAARVSAAEAAADATARAEEARGELAAVEAERQRLRADLEEQYASTSCPLAGTHKHGSVLRVSFVLASFQLLRLVLT